jgi:8-oxo-dGTP pyrophosphatase MutT (NUDIX family)
MSLQQFTPAWREHLRAAVSPLNDGVGPLEVRGLGPEGRTGLRPRRTAAVLVPVLDEPEPAILLTRRAEHLAQHAGQISFPGGRAEEADNSAVQTALREAYEEIGLEPGAVTPVGFLDRFDIISDYRVLPVVGLVRMPVQWRLDESEVAEVFAVPCSVALDRTQYRKLLFQRDGQRHAVYSLDWEGRQIWGATAAMMLNLARRLEHQLLGETA